MPIGNQSAAAGEPVAVRPLKPQLHLQSLTADLLPAVVELDRRCFGQLWTLAGYQRELASPNSEILILRAADPGVSPLPPILGLGCYWAILEEAHITIVAIDPEYHHQGWGQWLLGQLLHSAHHRGLERATLEVRASHQAAIALYTKFAFREAGRRKDYYPDTHEDALILWLSGLHHPDFPQRWAAWEQQARDRLTQNGWPPPFVAIP
jgi:[ribosomal protein S18]-alanine N-acetyltransferase